jgi:hypothetical protein
MEFIAQLWLPIIVSAAAVWMASAIVWTVLPHHRDDFRGLPDEGAFAAAVGPLNIPSGNYGFPHCESHAKSRDAEFAKRWKAGPRGMLSVWPEKISMPRNMILTFLVYLVVSVLIAYLGWVALGSAAPFRHVFRFVGTAGILAYSFAFIPNGIWFRQYARALFFSVIDGIAYGLITGAIFASLWPKV